VDLTQDQVYSAASLNIGQGNVFRGQENKDLFFPKSIKFFPAPTDVSVVKEGLVWKRVAGDTKGGVCNRVFKKSQRDFLMALFNNKLCQQRGKNKNQREGH
jgi:hypothetical protein